jgi:hypothetical protein
LKINKPVKIVISLLIVGVVIYYIARTLAQNSGQLREYHLTFRFGWLALSFGLMLASHLLLPWIWSLLFRCFGLSVGYADSLEVLFLSYLTRYVPGRVLTILSQIGLAGQKKIPAEVSATTAVLYQLISVLAGLEVFLLTVLVWPVLAMVSKAVALAAGVLLVFVSTRTALVRTVVRAVIKKIKGAEAPFELGAGRVLAIQAVLLSSWLIFAGAVYCLLRSFIDTDLAGALIVTGIQAVSWLVGYYTLFSPGGLGIREGVQIVMLKGFFPAALAVLIPVVLRLWMTLGDVLVFLVGVAVRLGRRRGAGLDVS